MAAGEEFVDRLLHKATNPSGSSPDWQAINTFAQAVSESQESVQSALRLMIHRIQSFNEKEALNGLLVLDVCAEKCGKAFHDEIGKFRFLNELIKLVSPKYLGNHTSPAVKNKVIEILYNWTKTIKDQLKIQDAYEMLKRQKVVTEDPIINVSNPPPPRPKNSIFDDEEKSKVLQKLLRSGNRDDALAANRLIKTMVKEDEKRIERISRRSTELETVRNNVKVLSDMLSTYQSGTTSSDDVELIKELYQTCQRFRPNLFRLASDTDEKDENLGDILKANDELVIVIENYQRIFGKDEISNESPDVNKPVDSNSQNPGLSANMSLLDLDSPAADKAESKKLTEVTASFIDDQLLCLDEMIVGSTTTSVPPEKLDADAKSDLDALGDIFSNVSVAPPPSAAVVDPFGLDNSSMLLPTRTPNLVSGASQLSMTQNLANASANLTTTENKKGVSKGLEDLDALGLLLLKQSLPPNSSIGAEFSRPPEKVPMNKMKKQPIDSALIAVDTTLQESSNNTTTQPHDFSFLVDLFVPLESINPGKLSPLTLYDKNGVNVVIHFGKDSPRPDVSVMAVTTINKSSHPMVSYFFQAAVPKSMKVKLQPPSATQLPGFNPILPPAAITQVMLLAKSSQEKVKLKYKLGYNIQDKSYSDIGEVEVSLT